MRGWTRTLASVDQGLASWGSLGDFTYAEPDALIGFLGPLVQSEILGRKLERSSQRAEMLAQHDYLDGIVNVVQFRQQASKLLAALTESAGQPTDEHLEISINHGQDGSAISLRLARIGTKPCLVLANDRAAETSGHPFGLAALNRVMRAAKLAENLGLPLVTIVDTAGAEVSETAEEGFIAGRLAEGIATLNSLTVPCISVLAGAGTGGGALLLLAGDQVVATSHSWLSPLPLAGASKILFSEGNLTEQAAQALRVSATELFNEGFVDELVDVPEQASDEELWSRIYPILERILKQQLASR